MKLSKEDYQERREIGAWLESIKNSDACRRAARGGRHVNIHLSFLREAWEAHRREK